MIPACGSQLLSSLWLDRRFSLLEEAYSRWPCWYSHPRRGGKGRGAPFRRSSVQISVRGSIGRFVLWKLSIDRFQRSNCPRDLKGTVPARFDIAGKELAVLIVQNQSAGAVPEVRLDSSGRLLLDERSANSQAGSWLEVVLKPGTRKEAAHKCALRRCRSNAIATVAQRSIPSSRSKGGATPSSR